MLQAFCGKLFYRVMIGTFSKIIRLEMGRGMMSKRRLAEDNDTCKTGEVHQALPLQLNLHMLITEASNGQRFNQTSTVL